MSSAKRVPRTLRPAGRPPGSTAEQTRAEILEAALEAFAAEGFEAMSVRELTRRLGVSHNLVHHHFGTKQDLWRAALEHGLGEITEDLIGLVGENIGKPDPVDVMREGLERAMALLERRPAVARILADEGARTGPRLDFLYDEYLKPSVVILERFLTEAHDHGVRNSDPKVSVLFLLSAVTALSTQYALALKLGLDPAKQVRSNRAMIDLILEGMKGADRGAGPRD